MLKNKILIIIILISLLAGCGAPSAPYVPPPEELQTLLGEPVQFADA
jgi:hypothetical protein